MATPNMPRIRLVLDWDGTMTSQDTTAVIGSRCLSKAREFATERLASNEVFKPMEYYSEKYFNEYKEWKRCPSKPTEQRKTIEDEISFLSESKHVEQDSFLRVRKAVLDLLGNMSETERDDFMMNSGREALLEGEVQIRDLQSLKNVIRRMEEAGNEWGVVSVSWSRRFISGALIELGLMKEVEKDTVAKKIRCNELLGPIEYENSGIPRIICSAKDKQDALESLLADWDASLLSQDEKDSVSSKGEDPAIVIYVGDSSTDLGCLTGAAIGMHRSEGGSDDPMIKTMKRLGIDCLPMSELPTSDVLSQLAAMREDLRKKDRPPNLVFLMRGFDELETWLSKMA